MILFTVTKRIDSRRRRRRRPLSGDAQDASHRKGEFRKELLLAEAHSGSAEAAGHATLPGARILSIHSSHQSVPGRLRPRWWTYSSAFYRASSLLNVFRLCTRRYSPPSLASSWRSAKCARKSWRSRPHRPRLPPRRTPILPLESTPPPEAATLPATDLNQPTSIWWTPTTLTKCSTWPIPTHNSLKFTFICIIQQQQQQQQQQSSKKGDNHEGYYAGSCNPHQTLKRRVLSNNSLTNRALFFVFFFCFLLYIDDIYPPHPPSLFSIFRFCFLFEIMNIKKKRVKPGLLIIK